MMKIWYIVKNCGDGSVKVEFYDTKELAEFVEEREEELYDGWGEPSVDYLEVKDTGCGSKIHWKENLVSPDMQTKYSVFLDLFTDYLDYHQDEELGRDDYRYKESIRFIEDFINIFFDGKLPSVLVTSDDEDPEQYVILECEYDSCKYPLCRDTKEDIEEKINQVKDKLNIG